MQGSNHITTVSAMTEAFAVLVLVLVAGAAISLVCAHIVDRGVDPLRDAVSDFGAREHPWFYRLTAIWLGAAGILTAVALADAMFPKPTLTILALLVFATMRWAITIFPTDLEDEEETSIGRSHTALAAIAFVSIAVAAVAFVPAARPDEFWVDKAGLLTALAFFVSAFAIATGIARAVHNRFFGLIERLLYVAIFAWLATIAILLLAGS
jgi:hypothetical protein